jgi:hypothetical protein
VQVKSLRDKKRKLDGLQNVGLALCSIDRRLGRGSAKHEINGRCHAQGRPEKIQTQTLLHIKDNKRHKYRQRDDFLEYFQLR